MADTKTPALNNLSDLTFADLIAKLQADTEAIASAAKQAAHLITSDQRNGAIGALLIAEREANQVAAIFNTILALHRSAPTAI